MHTGNPELLPSKAQARSHSNWSLMEQAEDVKHS